MNAATLPASRPTAEQVLEALHDVIDPEIGYNIVDIGLVYNVAVNGDRVDVRMTMTTPGCPAQDYIRSGVQDRSLQIPGVDIVAVELVWEPRWSVEKMSPAAKAYLGISERSA